jgi:uncharacterized DUF497 family protein
MNFRFSNHASEEMQKRKVLIATVEDILENPQQIFTQDEDTKIYQSQLDLGTGKVYLIRVFINDTIDPAVVVTVYRTSKIQKYWRVP